MFELMLALDFSKMIQVGFSGEIQSNLFITGSELASLAAVTTGTLINNETPWLKMNIDTDIIYIPKLPIRSGATWAQLDALGLINGKIIQIRNITYLCRVMTGFMSDPADASFPGGEWNQLMYAVCADRPVSWNGPKLANYSKDELGFTTGVSGRNNHTRERHNNGVDGTYRGGTSVYGGGNLAVNGNSSSVGWRPILIKQ